MAPNVSFDDERAMLKGMPRLKSVTMTDKLVSWGIARSASEANVMLLVVGVLMLVASYYIFQWAIPPEPVLGHDVLMPGESVPSYVKYQN
jgi:hypothetical protein